MSGKSQGHYRDKLHRRMVRWVITQKKGRASVIICYCMAATAKAALRAARNNGIQLDKTASAHLENSFLATVVKANDQQESAARLVLQTRDFCGDENKAITDFCLEEGIQLTHDFVNSVMLTANVLWEEDRLKAKGF